MPKLINIKDYIDGMELSAPIKNKYGQILLSSDIKIDEKHLKLLKIWGIHTIYIKDELNDSTGIQYDENAITEAKIKLKEQFEWTPRNENENDLYELALQVVLEKYFT